MKLIAFLRKIGILRHGSVAATYRSAKDAPDMLVTDIFPSQSNEKPAADKDKPTPSPSD